MSFTRRLLIQGAISALLYGSQIGQATRAIADGFVPVMDSTMMSGIAADWWSERLDTWFTKIAVSGTSWAESD